MLLSQDMEFFNTLGKIISKFERFYLEGTQPEEFDLADLLNMDEQFFFRIKAIANFWESDKQVEFGQYMTDLVISARSQYQIDLSLIILGTVSQVAIYVSLGKETTTRTLLEAIFPDMNACMATCGFPSTRIPLAVA